MAYCRSEWNQDPNLQGPYCHYTYIAVKHQQQGTLLYMCTINTQTQKQCLCSGNKIVIAEMGIVDDHGCILMHYR